MLALASSAQAQVVVAPSGPRSLPAPWWIEQRIIPATGVTRLEVPANRASFWANFAATESTAPKAAAAASERVKALGDRLAAYGADRVRVEFSFSTEPVFERYRGPDGRMIINERADKVEAYTVEATVSVEVRAMPMLERVYGDILSARPDFASDLEYSYHAEPDFERKLLAQAVTDAAQRARMAAAAVGARLGPVKLIDPSAQVCATDRLVALAPPGMQTVFQAGQGNGATLMLLDGQRAGGGTTNINQVPMSALSEVEVITDGNSAIYGTNAIAGVINLVVRRNAPIDIRMPIQPPLIPFNKQACVVYQLN